MTESRSTSSTAATVAKIGVTAALVAGMAVTAPVATFAADESDQDVDGGHLKLQRRATTTSAIVPMG